MPLQQGQLDIQSRLFDRQGGKNAGLFVVDGRDAGNRVGAVEGDAVMLDAAQIGQRPFR